MHIAGSPCVDWSNFGLMKEETGQTTVDLLAWLSLMVTTQPDQILLENVNNEELYKLVRSFLFEIYDVDHWRPVKYSDKAVPLSALNQTFFHDIDIQLNQTRITNSINYGSEKGTTEISFESDEENIMIKVNDNGEGISEENMPRLFQRFFRVDISRSRSQGGSGLGLAIVKHIIDAHNENIYVQSTIGIGSEFSFSLKKSKVL